MSAPAPIIELNAARIFQRENLILDNVDFTVRKGEFIYLIGRTGSGKSSLMRTLYGDLPLTHGEGHICGFDLRKLKRREVPYLRRKLGIVFQDFQLLSDRSVNENLVFVMKSTGWKAGKDITARVQEVLEQVGLGNKGYKMPHELSGGEQQRVSIARALVNHPELILADEPTGNLDRATADAVFALMMDLAARHGTAFVVVTHDEQLAGRCGRTLRLVQGKLGPLA